MAGLISFFGSRLMAWAILGGGGLLLATSVWQGAKQRGASIESLKWRQVIAEKVKTDRDANYRVNTNSLDENASLQDQETAIRRRWLTEGRAASKEVR